MVGGTKFDSQSDDHGPSTGTDLIFIFMLIVSLSLCNLFADVYEYYDADNHLITSKEYSCNSMSGRWKYHRGTKLMLILMLMCCHYCFDPAPAKEAPKKHTAH